ncbi:Transcription factor bHLH104 [Linum perenne]
MDSIDDTSCWDFLDNFIDEPASSSLLWPSNNSGSVEIDFSSSGAVSQLKDSSTRKRTRNDSSSKPGAKACRERMRREKLNDRFQDLSAVLEPGRPVKADKPAILDDAIRALNQLKSEAQELKETNEKLQEEIKGLKAEKNELREEKLTLKADKERMEQQVKAMGVPTTAGYMPAHPSAYHGGANKMPMYPGYSLIPMWQYLPPAAYDTSRDHELRPPAA